MERDSHQPSSQEHRRSHVGCETDSVSLKHECQSLSYIDSSTATVKSEPTLAQSHEKVTFNDDNDGAAQELKVPTVNLEEMFNRSAGNMSKTISELKYLNTNLSGLEKDQAFSSRDPEMAFKIEYLKHAFREVVIFSHRFIGMSTSLAKYASNEEYIHQLGEDLSARQHQRLKPFIDGIIRYISRCKLCLDQHQQEYEKVKKLVCEFLPCSEAYINVDDYVVINPESTSDKSVTKECSEYSPQSLRGPNGWFQVGGLISSFTSSLQSILSSPSRNPRDTICTDHSKLNSIYKLIIQFQKSIAGLCESLIELEDYLRNLDETTVTCEQIHYIQSTMKDLLKAI